MGLSGKKRFFPVLDVELPKRPSFYARFLIAEAYLYTTNFFSENNKKMLLRFQRYYIGSCISHPFLFLFFNSSPAKGLAVSEVVILDEEQCNATSIDKNLCKTWNHAKKFLKFQEIQTKISRSKKKKKKKKSPLQKKKKKKKKKK